MKRKPSQTVVYQIYPRSFKDGNGDGVGDLKGVIEKLDYLASLEVDLLWLTPFYVSPGNDNGYDIEDYYHVDPKFGKDEDLEVLIDQAKKRNMGIMLDMVFNHTSTYHPWFQKALAGDKKYQEYYFFREEKTNWQSKFGGSAWEYVEDLGLYYLHLYDVTQADWNWESEDVFQEICKISNYWLDKGVQGLRYDVINLISKPDEFLDDHQGDGRRYYTDGKNVHQYLNRLNVETFGRFKDIITVGELSSTHLDNAIKYASPDRHELSTVFGFHHLKVDYPQGDKWSLMPFDFQQLKQILREWQLGMQQANALTALFWCNHDQPRVVSRFGNDQKYLKQSAKMLATVVHLMRGMPYIYQGEEIGMGNAYFDTIEAYRDIESLNMYQELLKVHPVDEVMEILKARSRDNSRTPILWNHSKYYGFSPVKPWIDFSNHPSRTTVEDSIADSDSIYYWYKELIRLRHEEKIVSDGKIEFIDLDHPYCFNYIRSLRNKKWLVLNNFFENEVPYHLQQIEGAIKLSNYNRDTLLRELTLKPYETLVIEYEQEKILL